ncbi:MAG: selenide, water dikinase SelD, partial [Chloroflexota bacterium]
LQWLPGAMKYAENDVFPGGMERNREHFEQVTTFADDVGEPVRKLLFDPETSGGLLIAVAADSADALAAEIDGAVVIGEVRSGTGQMIFTQVSSAR